MAKVKQPSTDQNVPGESSAVDTFGEAPRLPGGQFNPDEGNKGGEGPMGRTEGFHPEPSRSGVKDIPGRR